MSDKKSTDSKETIKKPISRRDFVGGTLLGSGAALLSSAAPGVKGAASKAAPDKFALGRTMPLPLTGLDASWSGPGGVGDYASSNGNTHDVVNAAHTFRNDDFAGLLNRAKDSDEEYDLVVVGAGFAGCTAAYTYRKENPDARVLILDNHSMFGGEARQNEFEVDGHRLWAPQGSTGAVWPLSVAKKIGMYSPIWDQLKLPQRFEWQQPTNSDLKIPEDNYTPMHLAWEKTDLGWFHEGHGMAVNPWANRFKDVPFDTKTKNDFLWMETYRQPPEREDWDRWLDSMTYKEFLINEMGLDNPIIHDYLNPFGAAMGMGLGGDVISALQASNFLQPGVTEYGRVLGLGDPTNDVILAQWPGGNTGTLRHIVKELIPGIFGDSPDLGAVLSNPIDRDLIDNKHQKVRMRLSSLVVNVKHRGPVESADVVDVTYHNGGEMHKVTAKHVVMGGQQHLNKRVVSDLPQRHLDAMDQFMHAPMMLVNVALTNWKFMDKLGVASVRWFGDDMGWFTTLRKQMIIDGKEPMPLDPAKPTVLTLYNSFCMPGLAVDKQCVAARMKMFSLSYADIESHIKRQFTKMFGSAGFNAERDIAGIVVNRQGHAYAATPPGFFFGKDGKPAVSDVIREQHGRIAFAHAELMGMQMWEGAVHEGERAGHQLSGHK
ncbi:MAG: NAD(P)-binding protein [Pseudomonadales bacterium]